MESVCSLEKYVSFCESKESVKIPLEWIVYICKDKHLTQSDKIVWILLANYSVMTKTSKVYTSTRILAQQIGRNKRTASRSLKALEEFGYIITTLESTFAFGGTCACIDVRFPESAISLMLADYVPKGNAQWRESYV